MNCRKLFKRVVAFLALVLVAALLPLAGSLSAADDALAPAPAKAKPNVLFIAVDDLNHWVGHLGRNKQTKTPNLDRLAKMGVTFANAHCAAPVCNPSRAALLSGKRPSTTGIYDNGQPFEAVVKAGESLVMQFKNAGYETLGMGKLWHGGLGFAEQWTATGGRERGGDRGDAEVKDRSIGGIRFGIIEGGDDAVPDTHIANYGIAELGKKHDKPFFFLLVSSMATTSAEMPWDEACDIGLCFKQDAIYTVNGDALSVTLCDHRRGLVPVGACAGPCEHSRMRAKGHVLAESPASFASQKWQRNGKGKNFLLT